MILGKFVVTGKLLFSLYESSYYVPGIHAGLSLMAPVWQYQEHAQESPVPPGLQSIPNSQ